MSSVISVRLRILVVEDNQDGADTIARILRLWGQEARIARDGRAGVEEAKLFRPDVVLMDIGLPILNGFEAARQVRTALGPAVTLVALTACSSDADRKRGREAGFDHYLVKPVLPSTLQLILSTAGESKSAKELT